MSKVSLIPTRKASERIAESMMNGEITPKEMAFRDYRKGGGHADNPYLQGTNAHDEYMWEMNKMYLQELKTLRAEIAGGV